MNPSSEAMHPMKSTTDVSQVAASITSWIGTVSTEIENLSRKVAGQLERYHAGTAKSDKIALNGLDGLDEFSRDFLARNTFAVGAWVFFDSESVDEGSRTVEWWSRNKSGGIGRVDCDQNPGSQQYYDYEQLPFFSTAAVTGNHTLWGPYVDYLGCEEYVLSFAAPFSVQGKFLGVAGCDIRIRDLEAILMPALRDIPSDAAVVTASNRVVLGNSGMYLVGERVKSDSPNLHRLALDLPPLGLSLIYTA